MLDESGGTELGSGASGCDINSITGASGCDINSLTGASGRDINSITGAIVDAAYQIHVNFGPGLLESVYETILARDLVRRGFRVERQKRVSFEYDGLVFENAFRVDLLVDSQVVVEVKSISKPAENHAKQLLTYLRLLDCRVGLLLNFGAVRLKDGITRIANNA